MCQIAILASYRPISERVFPQNLMAPLSVKTRPAPLLKMVACTIKHVELTRIVTGMTKKIEP